MSDNTDLEEVEEDIKEEAKEVALNKEVAITIVTEAEVETMKTETTIQETKVMITTVKKFRIMMTNTNKNTKKRGKFSMYQSRNLSISQSSKRMMLLSKIKMIRLNRGKREDTLTREEVAKEEAEVVTDLLNTMRDRIMNRALIKRSHMR